MKQNIISSAPISSECFTFHISLIYLIFAVTFSLVSCSQDRITEPPQKPPLPKEKEVLLKYHPERYLTTDIKSAPLLAFNNHPDGWQKADCTKCHQTPSKEAPGICTNCHGKNGVDNQEDTCSSCHKVTSKYGDPPNGQHQAHVVKNPKDITCEKCHPGQPQNSTVHANGILNIRFAGGGAYVAASDTNQLGSCQNIGCHEDRTWGGEGCSSCHYDPPDTGYHAKHVSEENLSCQACHKDNQHDSDKKSGSIEVGGIEYNSITGDCISECHKKPRKWKCTNCHGYPPQSGNHSPSIHKFGCDECHSNHIHSYNAAIQPKDFSNVKVELKGGGEYRDASNDGIANGLCSGTVCHKPRIWGGSCTECHGQPPETGTHVLHVEREGNTCQDCHKDNKHEPDNGSGVIDIGGVGYNFINGACISSCHQQRQWNCTTCHEYPPKSGNHLQHQIGCDQCHNNHVHSPKVATAPRDFSDVKVELKQGEYKNGLCSGTACHEPRPWGEDCGRCHGFPPKTGIHVLHVEQEKTHCQDCHEGAKHNNTVEVGNIGYNFINGNCTSSCHQQQTWNCTTCHDYPPKSGNHLAHNEPTGRYFSFPRQSILCDECHANHRHSDKAAIAPNDFSEVKVRLQGGTFNPSNKLCSVNCHNPQKWGTSCSDCHGAPPDTGRHSIHLISNLNCDDCHKNHQHDLDISSGIIEVGNNISYDQFTGDCTSTCHEKKQWDCTSCHGYPPDTGQHKVHTKLSQFNCRICHKNHEHTFRAATNPNDQRNVKVSFAILGDWDKSTNSCKNIGCHVDKKW